MQLMWQLMVCLTLCRDYPILNKGAWDPQITMPEAYSEADADAQPALQSMSFIEVTK